MFIHALVDIWVVYTFLVIMNVHEKLINSQLKKEMENFTPANLRIITLEAVSQKPLRTVPPVRGQSQS